MDNLRSNNNGTSLGPDTISSYTRNDKSVIKDEPTHGPKVQVK